MYEIHITTISTDDNKNIKYPLKSTYLYYYYYPHHHLNKNVLIYRYSEPSQCIIYTK